MESPEEDSSIAEDVATVLAAALSLPLPVLPPLQLSATLSAEIQSGLFASLCVWDGNLDGPTPCAGEGLPGSSMSGF